jgi:cobalt-zinc-cadmium efflux system membrane fusion protein
MMKKLVSILAGVILLGAGAALVVLADQKGWLPGGSTPEQVAQGCPHDLSSPSECPFCDSSLIESMGFCYGHNVPEAFCTQCSPYLIPAFKATNDWCAGHDIPESQCTICNPGLLDAADKVQGSVSQPFLELVRDPETPRSQRPPGVTCQTSSLRVQFLSPETARDAGLEYARVERRKITQAISCNLEIAYDGSRYARLASRASGTVSTVNKDLGESVEGGEVLAEVDASDLGTARAEYLQARTLINLWEKNLAIEKRLLEKRAGTERDMLEVETRLTESRIALSRAQQRLRNLGFSDAQIDTFSDRRDSSSLLPLTAPFPGVVVERDAVVGEVVDTKTALLAIADTSRMWAMLDVYESDVPMVRVGQPVVLEVEGIQGERRGGTVTWVSSQVDRRTRTLKVRAEVDNVDRLLRSGMYGKAVITIHDEEPVLIVPKDAVQWEGCCNVVFARQSDTLFAPRKVRLGYDTGRFYVVEQGVEENQEIVTTGSFLLKTEILKGSIGAGCCEASFGRKDS